MLKELAEKIEDLVEGQVEPEVTQINGVDYIKDRNGFSRLNKPSVDTMSVNTLSGLSKIILATVDNVSKNNFDLPLLVKVEGNRIDVFTNLDVENKREYVVEVRPMVPSIEFGYFIPVEKMIILLSTAFEKTSNTDALINSISNLRQVNEVEIDDDGVTQKVIASNGTSLNKEWKLQPIVLLKPIRTYAEIEQVESKYLLRVNNRGEIALFEADGGLWKFEAQQRIVMCLEQKLKELITKDQVRVIG